MPKKARELSAWESLKPSSAEHLAGSLLYLTLSSLRSHLFVALQGSEIAPIIFISTSGTWLGVELR